MFENFDLNQYRLPRRSFLRATGGAVVAFSALGLLAACGDDDDDTDAPASSDDASDTSDDGDAAVEEDETEEDPADADDEPEDTPDDSDAADAPSGDGGTLNVAIGTSISTLEPHLTTETSSGGVRVNLYDGLLTIYNEDSTIEHQLAESFEATEDGLTYTFDLVDDEISFHDGTEFNADAVTASFERLLDPDRASAAKNDMLMIEEVEAIDERTVAFHLNTVFSEFPLRIADGVGHILSPAAIEELGEDYGQNPIGCGPYRFVEHIADDRVVFERYEDYWGEPAAYDRIVYRIIPEDSSRGTLLQTGEVQVSDRVPPVLAEELDAIDGIRIESMLTARYVYFVLNRNRELMTDLRVRQAVYHAVDRDAIIDGLLRGYGEKANSPVGPTLPFHAEQPGYEYDMERAAELLEEAGIEPGTEIVIWTPQGRYVGDRDMATAVQGSLTELGFNAQLQAFGDFPAYIEELDTLEYDMAIWGWTATSGLLLLQPFDGQFAGGFPNWGSFDNEEVNQALREAEATIDDEERYALFAEAQRIIMEDVGGLILYWQENPTGVSDDVENVYVTSHETLVVRDARPAS